MPRTRLHWQLFVGWCVLLAGVLAGCFWLASLRLADLASMEQRRRLVDAATGAVRLTVAGDGTIDTERFRAQGGRCR